MRAYVDAFTEPGNVRGGSDRRRVRLPVTSAPLDQVHVAERIQESLR